jgi:DNA-binding NarL/FixJ family response regulator
MPLSPSAYARNIPTNYGGVRLQTGRPIASTLGQVKVFLVEDAPLLRERLVALIASVGASTVGHADGAREAIDGILASAPDAVVLDLHLKEGNGFDVLRAVRKAAPAIAFFIVTNHPHEGYRASAERLGARGFYDKSSEFDKLREALAAAAV